MKEISKGESVNYLNDLVSFKFHRSLLSSSLLSVGSTGIRNLFNTCRIYC